MENKGSGDWEKHTKEIIDIQAEWKTIGFAPQKMNVKIFERFRAACDDFFGRKATYFKTLWTAACQASLSITNSWSLPKLMSIELVMSSNHLILCHPLLLPSIFPSMRVFSNESV